MSSTLVSYGYTPSFFRTQWGAQRGEYSFVLWGGSLFDDHFASAGLCFASIKFQRRRNKLPLFALDLQNLKRELCQNSLPKVRIATYELPKKIPRLFVEKWHRFCALTRFLQPPLYGDGARLFGPVLRKLS